MRHIVILMLLLAPCWLLAQEVQLNEEPRIGQLMKAWADANRTASRIAGWRVQILSTADRAQADAMKLRFKADHPDAVAEWYHEKPYYKVRVGAFRTKLEAMAFIAEIRDFYPGCYPAQDPAIHPRDFLK
jgi:SPOR domain